MDFDKAAENRNWMRNASVVWVMFAFIGFAFSLHAQVPDRRVQLARELERSANWEQAIVLYEALYRENPNHAGYFSRLRSLYLRAEAYEKAIRLIDERRAIYPNDPSLSVYRAQIRYKMGETEEAMTVWEELLEQYPKQASVYQMIATAMIGERLLDEAIDVYVLGRERLGRDDLFVFNLANLYVAQLQYDKATEELLKDLEINPKHAAIVESQLLRFPSTEDVMNGVIHRLKKAVYTHTDTAGVLKILVSVYLRVGKYPEALETSREIEVLTPAISRGNALFQFGLKSFQAGMPREAEKAFDEIRVHYPEYAQMEQVLFRLAQSYEAQDRLEEAAEAYQRVFDEYVARPLGRQALYRKGLLQKDGQFDFAGAARTFRILVERFSTAEEGRRAWFDLGECEIAQGHLEEAESLFREAYNLFQRAKGRFWFRAIQGLSEALYFNGRFDEALSYLKELSLSALDAPASQEPLLNDALHRRIFIGDNVKRSPEPLRIFSRVEFYEKQRMYDAALGLLDSLISTWNVDPIVADAFFKQGHIRILAGRIAEGLKSYETFISRFPSHVLADRAVERMGWICENTGKWKEALEYYEFLLTEYPQSFSIHEIRQRIRRIERERKG